MIVSPFVHIFDIISFFAAELEEPKIGIWGKGLNTTFNIISVTSYDESFFLPAVHVLFFLSHRLLLRLTNIEKIGQQ